MGQRWPRRGRAHRRRRARLAARRFGRARSPRFGLAERLYRTLLLRSAKKAPEAEVRVIVQSTQGLAKADKAARKVGRVSRRLGLVGAVVAHVPASRLKGLGQVPGLTVTPDSVVRPTDRDDDRGRDRDDDRFSSKELWPEETGLEKLWSVPATPTIAIVDSGIQSGRKDFGDRIVARVNLTTLSRTPPATGVATAHSSRASQPEAGTGSRVRLLARESSRSMSWTTPAER